MFDGTDVMGTTRRRDKWESGSEHVGGDNLGEGDKDDEKFRSIAPSSTIRSRFLSAVSTSVFLRWYNNVPCILCHSTIPLDLTEVLKYLGEEDKISQYNEFLGNRDLTKDRGIELAPAGRKMKGSWFDLLDRVHWDDRGVRVGNKRDGLQQVLNDKYAESGELTLESQAEVENSVGSLSPDPGSNSTISAQPSLPNTWYIFPPKLVYGESPKILFVPPRSFISMVQLRVLRRTRSRSLARAFSSPISPSSPYDDISSVILTSYGINSTEYKLGEGECKEGRLNARLEKLQRANTIRSMSVLSRDGNNTSFSLIAHADPGGGLPNWAVRSVVNTLVGIEPFRFFHRVFEGANVIAKEGYTTSGENEGKLGLSQMGYAAFWDIPVKWGGGEETAGETNMNNE